VEVRGRVRARLRVKVRVRPPLAERMPRARARVRPPLAACGHVGVPADELGGGGHRDVAAECERRLEDLVRVRLRVRLRVGLGLGLGLGLR